MRKIFLGLLLLAGYCNIVQGQYTEVKAGSAIPQFRMQMSDGKYYSTADIAKNKPFVLIYFAPDCEHCLKLMDELFPKIHVLDKATVMLVTFKTPAELVPFEKKYRTTSYPNMYVGTEGLSYVLRNYYRLDKTPFTAAYNRKGKLVSLYKNETPVDKLLAEVKKM